MGEWNILKNADLPLEVVILIIGGITMLITGFLIFPISSGALPYYENGLYGLLLIIFALQTITLGKTPFGDIPRSKTLLAVGIVIASMGIVTGFVPDVFRSIPRLLLFLCFGLGGFLLLFQMIFSKDKLRVWIKYGGIFQHLIFACSLVYVMSMALGLFIWNQSLLSVPLAAIAVLISGSAILYLAVVLRNVYAKYPEAAEPRNGSVQLSFDQTMLLMMGIFMLLLGLLLIPVNLGLLPFSGSAQLGLLMIMFAVQMLASGNTPIGSFSRSWLMILMGLLFAALGIVSCIIPEILVPYLTVLVAALNILGGSISLVKIFIPLLIKSPDPQNSVPPIMVKLFAVQLTTYLLTVLFGISMFVSNLIPGLVIGVILAANGCFLLYMLCILKALEKL